MDRQMETTHKQHITGHVLIKDAISGEILVDKYNAYNQTYYKVVNDQSPLNLDPAKNYMQYAHSTGATFSDVIINCTLDLGEPAGQEAFDTAVDLQGNFVFNELGLKDFSSIGQNSGRLISHVIFSPIQKSLNRQIQVVYTIRIQTV